MQFHCLSLKEEEYMIYDSDRTQERKRQLELETALQKGKLEGTRTILKSLM